jgi:predicted transcriptional regulator
MDLRYALNVSNPKLHSGKLLQAMKDMELPMNVTEIQVKTRQRQHSQVSQSLKKLRKAGLVVGKRNSTSGKYVNYTLDQEKLDLIEKLKKEWFNLLVKRNEEWILKED